MRDKKTFWPTLKRLFSYARPYRQPLSIAVLMLWAASAAEVSGPFLIGYFIDHVLTKGEFSLHLAGGLAVLFLLLAIFAAILHYYQALLFNRSAVGVVQQLRTDVMDAALNKPLSVFDTQPVGQLISRVTNDTEAIRDLYTTVMATLFKGSALIVVMMIAMLLLDWRLTLIISSLFPAVLGVMVIYQRFSTPMVRQVRAYLADINDGFNEVINGMSVIQQFRQQQYFARRMEAMSRSHYGVRMKILRLDGFLLRPLLSLFSALVLCGLLLLFSFSSAGSVGVGVLYAFINYLARLNEPLIALASQQSILQQSVVAGERIFDLIDSLQQHYGEDQQPLNSGTITLEKVSFAYRDNSVVLQNISLQVPHCGFVALVGHTGSGKSTLANLLMGYYPITAGHIQIDGRSLSQLSHQVLRQGIAMVQQDPVVLVESVFENVTLGRDFSEVQVWQALENVQLADLVRGMPQGLQTPLGEQGNALSVGQKQLLALARVVIAPPRILILDEATANIDSGTEQALQQVLHRMRQTTTLVVIAHRLSTIVEADNILVLHHGQAVEQGTHQQLLASQGRYYQMYQLQQVGKALASV